MSAAKTSPISTVERELGETGLVPNGQELGGPGQVPNRQELFYAAAVAGLRALERRERSPRRFGPDADTRWAAFKGA
ncbi:MAG: hypothetical protein RBU37_19820, partial [Myxococcota bacterium]|nr:hypothetical protein [Myxococcota bacterium]